MLRSKGKATQTKLIDWRFKAWMLSEVWFNVSRWKEDPNSHLRIIANQPLSDIGLGVTSLGSFQSRNITTIGELTEQLAKLSSAEDDAYSDFFKQFIPAFTEWRDLMVICTIMGYPRHRLQAEKASVTAEQ